MNFCRIDSENSPTTQLLTNEVCPHEASTHGVIDQQMSTQTQLFTNEASPHEACTYDVIDQRLPTQTQACKIYTEKGIQTCNISVDQAIQVNTLDESAYDFMKVALKSEENLNILCGIPSFQVLNWLTECFIELKPNDKALTPVKNRIVMTCRKLRTKLSFRDIAIQFGYNERTCANYFHATIQILAKICQCLIYWPTKDEVLKSMPNCFKDFQSTRIVLDCTEVPIESFSCEICRCVTYSHYKGCHTAKFLICVTPSGLISYVSKGYGGRSTDKTIFDESKLLDRMENGDAIMVDKGFLIEKSCAKAGIQLYRPPFLLEKKFSKEQSEFTASIARARVHVERRIMRLKLFKILSERIPQTTLPYIDDIMIVVARLTNLGAPILSDDKFR